MLNQVRRDLGIPKENISLDSTGTGRLNMTGATAMSRLSMKTMDTTPGGTASQPSHLSSSVSQDTYDFQSTGAMFSTIHSNANDMSDTQALKNYELDITRKEADDEAVASKRYTDMENVDDDLSLVVRAGSLSDQPVPKVHQKNVSDKKARPLNQVHERRDINENPVSVTGENEAWHTAHHRKDESHVGSTPLKEKREGKDKKYVDETEQTGQNIPDVVPEMIYETVIPPSTSDSETFYPKPKPRLLKTDAIIEETPPEPKRQESEDISVSTSEQHADDEYDGNYEDDYDTLTDDDF